MKGNRSRFEHGHFTRNGRSPTYHSWQAMLARCGRPSHPFYARYAAKGITVCERWRAFPNFLADMGERPDGTSLDRVDNNGNYEPGNCRWATPTEQQGNRAGVRYIECGGERQTLAEWARRTGLPQATLWGRLKRGMTPEDAIGRPVRRAAVKGVSLQGGRYYASVWEGRRCIRLGGHATIEEAAAARDAYLSNKESHDHR